MTIINKIRIDLASPSVPPIIPAVQSDSIMRSVEMTLTANGIPLNVYNHNISIVFKKPDGTSGWYDVLPDQSSAITVDGVDGNVVTAVLAPQVLTVPGQVVAALRIEKDMGRATTFPFIVSVEPDPSAGGEDSNDYYRVTTWGDLNDKLYSQIFPTLNVLGHIVDYCVRTDEDQNFSESKKETARRNIGAGISNVAIDDASVGADAWSSKNIVERLCPRFTESGAVVLCDPVAGYPLEIISSISLVQDSTPAWEDVTDSYDFFLDGANTLACEGLTSGSTYKITTTYDAEVTEIHAESADGYIIDGKTVIDGNVAEFIVTLPSDFGIGNVIFVSANSSVANVNLQEMKSYPVSGHTAVEVIVSNETEEKSHSAELGQTVYGGNYDWARGILTVDWVKITIAGDVESSDSNAMQYPVPQKPFYNSAVASCVCSHYPSFGWTDLYKKRNDADAQGVATTSGASGNLVRIVDNVRFNGDADKANAWLAENPIEVAYKLAEPVTYQLAPREILALTGENTLSSTTGDTTVSGRADPVAVIESLTNAIIAQGGNV